MLTKNQIICINMSFHDSKSVGQAGLGQGTAVEVFVRDDKLEVQDRLKAVLQQSRCREDSLLTI